MGCTGKWLYCKTERVRRLACTSADFVFDRKSDIVAVNDLTTAPPKSEINDVKKGTKKSNKKSKKKSNYRRRKKRRGPINLFISVKRKPCPHRKIIIDRPQLNGRSLCIACNAVNYTDSVFGVSVNRWGFRWSIAFAEHWTREKKKIHKKKF